MDNFSFPVLRLGEVFGLEKHLDFEMAENIAKVIEGHCAADEFHADLASHAVESTQFTLNGKPESAMKAVRDLWEGWVTLSPAVNLIVKNETDAFKVRVRFSIVACMDPNNSKIWTSIMLLERAGADGAVWTEAGNLDRQAANAFFDDFSVVARNIASYAEQVYKDALRKVVENDRIKLVHSVLMKVVGSTDAYHHKLEQDVMAGDILKLSEAVNQAIGSEQGLKDMLFFVFKEEVDSTEKFFSLLRQKQETLGVATQETRTENESDDPLNRPGLHWFGFKYDHSAAVFLKEASARASDTEVYFGISPDHHQAGSERLEDMAAFQSSKALVQFVSPFL